MIRRFLLGCLLAWSAVAGASNHDSAAPARQVLVLVPMPPPHFRPDGVYGGGYSDAAGRAAARRTAAAVARSYGLHLAVDWPMPALGLDCYVMDVPEPLQPLEVATRVSREPGVAWAQPMGVFRTLGAGDPLMAQQPAAVEWHLDDLHRTATGRDVRVGVVDSGVQADHPDLLDQVAEQVNLVTDRPLVPELHGTAVAGIIAAREGNRVGIAGVAPLARIVGLRACWQLSASDTRCNSLSLALALSAAIERNVQVINMSLAGPQDRLIQRFIETAQDRGIAVVAARDGAARDGGFPASMKGVIAVSETPPPPTSHGVAAPGIDVLTTLPPSRWGIVSGSSYAAAHVSGLVALVLDARSRQGALRVRAPAGGIELVSGSDGRIDACATLQRAASSCVCGCGTAAMADSAARP